MPYVVKQDWGNAFFSAKHSRFAHPGAAAGHVDNDDVAGRSPPSLCRMFRSQVLTPKLRNEGNHLLMVSTDLTVNVLAVSMVYYLMFCI